VNDDRTADDEEAGSSGAEATTPKREATTPASEPEPAWADAIRRGRRTRAERLREVFAGFDDDPVEGGP